MNSLGIFRSVLEILLGFLFFGNFLGLLWKFLGIFRNYLVILWEVLLEVKNKEISGDGAEILKSKTNKK